MSDAWLEWSGAISGLLSVFLTARRRIACWPVGLVSVTVYGIFFFRLKLYADCALQMFFFATSLYGWWHWARGGPAQSAARITALTWRRRQWLLVVVAGTAVGIGSALHYRTDASLPYWDSLAASLSVTAQWLLMRKNIDTWPLWIAADVLSIGIYAAKGAIVTTALYAIFLVLAVSGLVSWRRARRRGELA